MMKWKVGLRALTALLVGILLALDGGTTEAQTFTMKRSSLNGGGQIGAASAVYTSGHSVGQSAAGRGSSATYDLDIGFWFGAAVCPVAKTGDVNVDNNITSADIIYLVNFVFKGGSPPLPCQAAGDVNCDGNVTSADIIYLVNFVFKGGLPPCDVCPLILSGTWPC